MIQLVDYCTRATTLLDKINNLKLCVSADKIQFELIKEELNKICIELASMYPNDTEVQEVITEANRILADLGSQFNLEASALSLINNIKD